MHFSLFYSYFVTHTSQIPISSSETHCHTCSAYVIDVEVRGRVAHSFKTINIILFLLRFYCCYSFPVQGLGRMSVPASMNSPSQFSHIISSSFGPIPRNLLRHSPIFHSFHTVKPTFLIMIFFQILICF
jgi:hypothetical protein